MFVAAVLRKVLLVLGYPNYTPNLGPYPIVGAIQTRILGSVACQIHYPAAAASKGKKTEEKSSFYPYFRPKAVQGLAIYSGQDPQVLGFLSHKNHPCWINADPLILTTKDDDNDDDSKTTNTVKFPVVLFSHGLGGCMEMYTQLCQQIASHGFIVVAMEHEDGSGAYAETPLGEAIYYKKPDDTPYSRNKVLNFRRPFLQQRVKETMAVLDALLLDPEQKAEFFKENTKAQQIFQTIADTTTGVALLGHSFGGATMILTVQEYLSKKSTATKTTSSSSSSSVQEQEQQQQQQPPIISSLSVLDPWAFSLEDKVLHQGIPSSSGIPTLTILSEAWLTNPEVDQVNQFLTNTQGGGGGTSSSSTSLYMPRAVHASFSDSVTWLPGFLLKKLRMRGLQEQKYETIQSVGKGCAQHIQTSSSRTTTTTTTVQDWGLLQPYKFDPTTTTRLAKRSSEAAAEPVDTTSQVFIESK
jgi:dienelactone hydrolase